MILDKQTFCEIVTASQEVIGTAALSINLEKQYTEKESKAIDLFNNLSHESKKMIIDFAVKPPSSR